MSDEWGCPECGNVNTRRECAKCGTEKPGLPVLAGPAFPVGTTPRRVCLFDGDELDAQGYCRVGGGFPVMLRCPFICPLCRRCLEWSGACFECHGSRTPADKQTWTLPGDRYETHDDKGQPIGDGQHWILQAKGPRRACTPEQNEGEAVMLARVLGAFDARAKETRLWVVS